MASCSLGPVVNIFGQYSLNANIFKQEGPRALDRSSESCHIRWCIGLWLYKEISFKYISIFSSGGRVVQLS